jgi:predicted regulator of Ras-like GTPase activity (Roadblock/LC7/MglB family)
MLAMATLADAVHDLRIRTDARAVALVSRDGQVLFADLPSGVYAETFSMMCATILGAAVTAHAELSQAPPVRVVLEADDATTVVVGCGPAALLVAVVPPTGDSSALLAELARFAAAVTSAP